MARTIWPAIVKQVQRELGRDTARTWLRQQGNGLRLRIGGLVESRQWQERLLQPRVPGWTLPAMSETEEQEATTALCAAFAVILRPWMRGEAGTIVSEVVTTERRRMAPASASAKARPRKS